MSQEIYQIKAGLLTIENQTNRLVPDLRQGLVQVFKNLEEDLLVFRFSVPDDDLFSQEYVLMAEDSSFHHISQCSTGEVFALKLLSSGEKAFFWLQDKAVKAAEVVKHLNSLMTHSNISDICAVNNLAASTPVGEQGKGIKVEALREVLKMDALEPEDLAQIESFLPPGTRADLGSLKSLFKTPYVAKSIETIEALMRSEEAPAFLNQFDLLSSCPGSPYGLAALLQALNAILMSGEQVPREAKLISILLTHAGVPECEPKVIQQLSEFMFSMDPRRVRSGLIFWFRWLEYTTDILQDAIIYGEHAGKGEVDIEDIKLAIQTHTSHVFSGPPSRDILLELAARKNAHPLPLFEKKAGFRLPPDNHCLLAANYKITSLRTVSQRPVQNEFEEASKRPKFG